ncbi:hypothetical protein EPI10_005320 [Gossypium australe]|uniref:Uncharacterized protein n=1 Tax=Gossypium australe TaxID=47621 RepID=A0A5B6WPJ8_9ROSI|nr:hypothetical protein EPI10_005320 [Gossypium australe]
MLMLVAFFVPSLLNLEIIFSLNEISLRRFGNWYYSSAISIELSLEMHIFTLCYVKEMMDSLASLTLLKVYCVSFVGL